MTAISKNGASFLWITLLTAASTATTLVLACATPFPALAALAAVHMRVRDGVLTMVAAWVASQFVGFFILEYPHDWRTLCWIPGLGTSAVASVLGAHFALSRSRAHSTFARLAIAYLAAFVAFKLLVLLWATGLGGFASTLDPAIVARQLLRNAAILAGLYALYRLAIAVGVPCLPRGRLAT